MSFCIKAIAQRQVINRLLRKFDDGMPCDFNNIYFELSNSASRAGSFPDDETFKNALKEGININYARAVLIKTEEKERSNIPVDVSKVTIEHLMPKALSKWWENYYGGEEKSKEIRNKYLNCIGNLVPMSQEYNSRNSNKPWSFKLKQLADIQFGITNEIARDSRFKEWKEENIILRNNEIANRVCAAITSPLKRTRDYENYNAFDFEPGIYDITDLDTKMEGKKPASLIFDDKTYRVSKWKEILPTICEILYGLDKSKFIQVIKEHIIHKSTSTKQEGIKDPIISENALLLNQPIKINGTNYFAEGNISSISSRRYSAQLVQLFDLVGYFQIAVDDNSEAEHL